MKNWLWGKCFNKKEQIYLLGILITGILIRIFISAHNQLWKDEVYFFYISHEETLIDLILQNYWDTVHPSLYYIIIHFWQYVSIHPLFLRSLSIFITLFTLYLIPLLAVSISKKPKVFPFLLLSLFALSPTQISMGIVVRPYPLVILLGIISLIFFLKIIKKATTSRREIIIFSVLNGLIGYTDYSGVWLVLSYYVLSLFFLFSPQISHQIKKNIKLALILTFLVSIPWGILFLVHLPNTFEIPARNLSPLFNTNSPLQANLFKLRYFSGTLYTDLLVQIKLFSQDALALFTLLISTIGIILLRREQKDISLFLIILLFFPLIFSFLFSVFVSPIFDSRNLHIVSFTVIVGLAYFLSYFYCRYQTLIMTYLAILCVNFIVSEKIIQYVDPPYDWQGVVNTVKNDTSIALITNEPYFIFDPVKYYGLVTTPPVYIHVLQANELSRYYLNEASIYFINTSERKKPDPKDFRYDILKATFNCKIINMSTDYLNVNKCIKIRN